MFVVGSAVLQIAHNHFLPSSCGYLHANIHIPTLTFSQQGTKNSSSSSYGGKASSSKSPAKGGAGAKNPSAPITKPSAAATKKSSYDDDDYGYGEYLLHILFCDCVHVPSYLSYAYDNKCICLVC